MPYKDEQKEKICKKEWRDNNKEHIKKYNKKYYQNNKYNPQYKQTQKKAMKNYKKNHIKRIRARDKSQYYLKHLRPKGYEFHHPDYNEPLNVVVMPVKEHKTFHIKLNQLNPVREAVLAS